jgi:hypothetical protein
MPFSRNVLGLAVQVQLPPACRLPYANAIRTDVLLPSRNMVLVNGLFRIERAYRGTHRVSEPRRIHIIATSVYASWVKVSHQIDVVIRRLGVCMKVVSRRAKVREAGSTTAMAMTFF